MDDLAATRYGVVRASLQLRSVTIAPLDLLIAAHALSADAVLITSDRTFRQMPDLRIEDWTLQTVLVQAASVLLSHDGEPPRRPGRVVASPVEIQRSFRTNILQSGHAEPI